MAAVGSGESSRQNRQRFKAGVGIVQVKLVKLTKGTLTYPIFDGQHHRVNDGRVSFGPFNV